jgi:hydrogenase nickel incorporation protein HypB
LKLSKRLDVFEEGFLVKVVVVKNILGHNDRRAASLRCRFKESRTLAVNLLSSPGSGKTSLIEKLIPSLKKAGLSVAVIEGDCATTNDARRIEAAGAPAVQVVTSGMCHLDAGMVEEACAKIKELPDVLFIENVGNLVCPAAFDLGEDLRMVLVSVPEGDDKPEKYPKAFLDASALVINKVDLKKHCKFRVNFATRCALTINSRLSIFKTSCATNTGIDKVSKWLQSKHAELFGHVKKNQAGKVPGKSSAARRKK